MSQEPKPNELEKVQRNLSKLTTSSPKLECLLTPYSKIIFFKFDNSSTFTGPYIRNLNKFSNSFIILHSFIGSFYHTSTRGAIG